MSSVISIKHLTKEYLISKGKKKEVFQALADINLEIESGKVTGLIGANGAGKSTLLKILSRITYPTSGQVHINGRLASLLEVGTGFHPELSGRENIFLNGAVLGMSRAEIQRQFDEIVDFSGVEEFLDTPVKHYSSGMYVRLAFSVAAHLQSEILLVDEVLAVGDAEFQKKCMGKMGETTQKVGRTILFVSHNLGAMRELCKQVIWLEHGRIKMQGSAEEVCNAYLKTQRSLSTQSTLSDRMDRQGAGKAEITALYWKTPNRDILICGEPATLHVGYKGESGPLRNLHLRLNVVTSEGVFLTSLSNVNSGQPMERASDAGMATCTFASLPLMQGSYSIMASLFAQGELQDRLREALSFEVEEGDFFGSGKVKIRNKEGVEVAQEWSFSEK